MLLLGCTSLLLDEFSFDDCCNPSAAAITEISLRSVTLTIRPVHTITVCILHTILLWPTVVGVVVTYNWQNYVAWIVPVRGSRNCGEKTKPNRIVVSSERRQRRMPCKQMVNTTDEHYYYNDERWRLFGFGWLRFVCVCLKSRYG